MTQTASFLQEILIWDTYGWYCVLTWYVI